ncbi:MAG: DUF2461 domain-containing protein [Actinomycetota bacterium]
MPDAFDGFPPETMAVLDRLGRADKAWFDANKTSYQSTVVEPTKAFVAAIGERLADGVAPRIVAQPKANGSIAPINNDLRFSPDKSPYKDHLMLRFWEGEHKKTAPTLFIRISPEQIGYATGIALPDLERWRALIDGDAGGELAAAIEELGAGREIDVAGEGYKRVPKPYAQEHPRADLLRLKSFQARWIEATPSSITTPGFVDHCQERLEACAPIHRWLVDHLGR